MENGRGRTARPWRGAAWLALALTCAAPVLLGARLDAPSGVELSAEEQA